MAAEQQAAVVELAELVEQGRRGDLMALETLHRDMGEGPGAADVEKTLGRKSALAGVGPVGAGAQRQVELVYAHGPGLGDPRTDAARRDKEGVGDLAHVFVAQHPHEVRLDVDLRQAGLDFLGEQRRGDAAEHRVAGRGKAQHRQAGGKADFDVVLDEGRVEHRAVERPFVDDGRDAGLEGRRLAVRTARRHHHRGAAGGGLEGGEIGLAVHRPSHVAVALVVLADVARDSDAGLAQKLAEKTRPIVDTPNEHGLGPSF